MRTLPRLSPRVAITGVESLNLTSQTPLGLEYVRYTSYTDIEEASYTYVYFSNTTTSLVDKRSQFSQISFKTATDDWSGKVYMSDFLLSIVIVDVHLLISEPNFSTQWSIGT